MSACVLYGASGRVGRLVAPLWPGEARFIARRAAPWVGLTAPLDPRNATLRDALQGALALILLAGPTAKAAQDIAGHADLARQAAQAARAASVPHLVLLSSAAVYGRARTPCREDDPLRPENAYGRAKQQMERAARDLAGPDLAVTVLRLGNVAGADALLGGAGAGPVMLDQFPDGSTPARSYIGPKVLARALSEIAARPSGALRTINLAQPGVMQMDALLDAAGIAWQPRPAPPTALRRLELDLSRAQILLDLPQATPADLVAQWHRAEGEAS